MLWPMTKDERELRYAQNSFRVPARTRIELELVPLDVAHALPIKAWNKLVLDVTSVKDKQRKKTLSGCWACLICQANTDSRIVPRQLLLTATTNNAERAVFVGGFSPTQPISTTQP